MERPRGRHQGAQEEEAQHGQAGAVVVLSVLRWMCRKYHVLFLSFCALARRHRARRLAGAIAFAVFHDMKSIARSAGLGCGGGRLWGSTIRSCMLWLDPDLASLAVYANMPAFHVTSVIPRLVSCHWWPRSRGPFSLQYGCRTVPFLSRSASSSRQCICPENKAMAEAFDELAGLYFKAGSKAGGVYKKACGAVRCPRSLGGS